MYKKGDTKSYKVLCLCGSKDSCSGTFVKLEIKDNEVREVWRNDGKGYECAYCGGVYKFSYHSLGYVEGVSESVKNIVEDDCDCNCTPEVRELVPVEFGDWMTRHGLG